jgi:TonB family protein
MKLKLLCSLLLFSIGSYSQNQIIYKAWDGQIIQSEDQATDKYERIQKSKTKFEIREYKKIGYSWSTCSDMWIITCKKDSKYKVDYYRREMYSNSIQLEVVDTLQAGYFVKLFDGNFCFAEAKVYAAFPIIFHGKCIYHFKEKPENPQVEYYYYGKKYIGVNQPKLAGIELPVNSCDDSPKFPEGLNHFVRTFNRKVVFPDKQNNIKIDGMMLIAFVVNSKGNISEIKLLNNDGAAIQETIQEALNAIQVPWIPAKKNGEAVDFKYILEIELKQDKIPDISKVLQTADKMPSFPGGELGLRKYIASVVRYPVEALKNGKEGTVYVNFIVDTDGNVRNPKVIRTVDPYLDEEAIRIVGSLPKWIPGVQDGNKVCVGYTVPIKFVAVKPAIH